MFGSTSISSPKRTSEGHSLIASSPRFLRTQQLSGLGLSPYLGAHCGSVLDQPALDYGNAPQSRSLVTSDRACWLTHSYHIEQVNSI